MDLTKLEKYEVSPEEEARLRQISSRECPECQGLMLVGDEEAGDMCAECYWAAVEIGDFE